MRRLGPFLLALFAPAACLWLAAQAPTHIVIAHTNDIHGQLLPKDGFGGIAEVAAAIRAENPDLILDAGDFTTGTFLADEFKGLPTIQAMNAIGYTASTVGNHEFDHGPASLRTRLREAKFPILSANIKSPVTEIKKYIVVTAKGIRFGIIGLTTDQVKTQSHPKLVAGISVFDTVKTLEQLLPEVRKKSDFVIALVHVEDEEERRIASAFPEIRLIIGGHNHSALGPIWLGKTLVVKTGVSGHRVGRVDLDFDNKKLTGIEAKLIEVKNIKPAPDVVKIVDPYVEKVNKKISEIIGEATDDLTYSRNGESPLGDLVADAFRDKGKTQIGIQNIGGIRARISKGQITWGNVFEVLPFYNTMVTLKLTGAQLKKTLERGLVPSVGVVAISGIRVQFDMKKPEGQRIVSLQLADGNLVEDSKLYSITTNDFVQVGGDGFTEFFKAMDVVDTGIFLRDVLVDYIKARRIISPVLDGRIVVN
ncbi:MAG TPA: 5'-nucleotidase C-terminal domain-containing protein [Terriglobia bacterium]|nr:5'-nucleotidase C-terminal domain-containing protein [Terriglobia bacterium]